MTASHTAPHLLLHEMALSLDIDKLANIFANVENLLIIQDLDGVCMGLVKDPLSRQMDLDYVRATKAFDGHFFVLTNGEHLGQRGVNRIIEKVTQSAIYTRQERLYLPGLAAGGVQWQDRDGEVSHPGVSEAEMTFLQEVPQRIRHCLQEFCQAHETEIPGEVQHLIEAAALDNVASPTANLNVFYERLRDRTSTYVALQERMQGLMEDLLADAAKQGLEDSFFVHYAPNLGRDEQGMEIVRFAKPGDSGTTDFQFMIRGAIKEAGVVALLNRYYHRRTGTAPLGEDFSVRQAPKQEEELLDLVQAKFDPQIMPTIIGVGDTVNSTVEGEGDERTVRRGGSDRNFLQLIQNLGRRLNKGNLTVYVDSSGGEVKNRKAVEVELQERNGKEVPVVVSGPGDDRDTEDPLTLNVVFRGGHEQYSQFFQTVAEARREISRNQGLR
ncbi:glucosylglycerol 3-phosphatase [Sodalinema gerasimenkoae]|uniref:glucosylglycerol 3-phosphatase n=1 Tax=Sodalinema gerasimenkoae TaxID=2862348 RepID=UPI001FEC6570|nr:glucosylglycerol 3-phosphatase [Sodalinema gerasimenkoae]